MPIASYYPTLFSRTAVVRDVTLFFPKDMTLYEPFTELFEKHNIWLRLTSSTHVTLRSVRDGGIQLAADLFAANVPVVYLIYHAAGPFGSNGGYEVQFDEGRAIVEVDQMNRIVVHPAIFPRGFSKEERHRARLEYRNQLANARRFVRTVFSDAFQSYFDEELPMPALMPI